jgi:hypothetical protein
VRISLLRHESLACFLTRFSCGKTTEIVMSEGASSPSSLGSLKRGLVISGLAYLARYILRPNLLNPTLLDRFLDACSPIALGAVAAQALGCRRATTAFAALSLLLAGACLTGDWIRSKKLLDRPLQPDDSYAIVTGASAGLGKSMAHKLAERGFHLVLVARREEQLQLVKEAIQELQPDAKVALFPADVSDPMFAQALRDRLVELGICDKVDVIVSNAGFAVHGPFLQHTWEQGMRSCAQVVTKLWLADIIDA